MNGEKADMVYTDPPYGMNLDTDYSGHPNWNGRHSVKKLNAPSTKYKPVIGDDSEFDPSLLFQLFPDQEMFLWGADYYADKILKNGSWIVWDKRTPRESETNFDEVPGSCFELCWSRTPHKRQIARFLHCGLYSVENDKRQHPTQKPSALHVWFFERWGKDKINIVDLYLGSGSTLIACEKTNRKCFGMEISPEYVQVCIDRFEKFSGIKAVKLN
jgi:DNA modification methylase